MKVKLLSVWVGPLPPWMPRFEAQMRTFGCVEWRLVHTTVLALGSMAHKRLGVPCLKGDRYAVCDYRPAYAEIFPEEYEGCDWWGWCDLDVVFGDLDRLLPELLVDGAEAFSFKDVYLSGCFAMFRNTERMRGMFRRGDFAKVLGDPHYHCWDESGHFQGSGEGFFHVMQREGVAMVCRPDLYLYDSPSEVHGVRWDGKRLLCSETGREGALFHFMSNRWPE